MLKGNEVSVEQIRKELLSYYNKHYTPNSGKEADRQIVKFGPDIKSGAECVFLVLAGTPPKGYALFIRERMDLCLYNAEGKMYKKYKINNILD